MSKIDYLRAVLPSGTRYSLRLVKKLPNDDSNIVRNKLFGSIEDMESTIDEYLETGWNVYYATAGFGSANNATADNAVSKREFYIDVDCGAGKPYADKAAGLAALRQFAKTVTLPKPTIVDSGNGIHAHWVLDAPIPVHEWSPIAAALKERCVAEGFKVDGGCTADTVRVLRIPDTINFKNNTEVKLLTPVVYYTVEQIRAAVGQAVSQVDLLKAARKLTNGDRTEVQKFLIDSKTSSFEVIWMRSVQGTGCAHIKNAIENCETLEEPLWRAALSVAQYCEDRDWAIHEISKNHAAYDPEQTEIKAAKTQGPYTCETFDGLQPGLCETCSMKGKIKSPIQIGSKVKEAQSNIVVEKVGTVEVQYEIPKYPYPYLRGKEGGIFMTSGEKDDDGNLVQAMIYHSDIYAFARQRHSDHGDVVWMRYHTRRDGVREFMLPMVDVAALDRLRDGVSKEGVTIFDGKQLKMFQGYLSKQIDELQFKEKADNMHARFGWTIADTFIVGDREYGKDGVQRVPTASVVQDYVEWFSPKGSLEKWKEIANIYNQPHFDFHAAGVLAGFGSVLMRISPENGGVLNYYSKASGTGKTTILKMANSIFGHPKSLLKDARDTHLSRVHRMGLLNGIVSTCDEMTNAPAEDLSNSLYGSTQGRGRDRMHSGANAERTNHTTWRCISVWSSNASVEDRLSTYKMDPQGELARLLEIQLPVYGNDNPLELQKQFNAMENNYGHAGHIYLSYVLANLDSVREVWEKVRDMLYSKHRWSQTERYKLNMVICMVTGGLIAKSLGLIDYDIQRIGRKLSSLVKLSADEAADSMTRAVESIANYANQNINNLLIINDGKMNGLYQAALYEPRGTLQMRYEPDTKTLYIAQKGFRRWCADNFINAKEMPTLFKGETGYELARVKKRMGKAWRADFGAVDAYEIQNACDVLGVDFEELKVNTATADETTH